MNKPDGTGALRKQIKALGDLKVDRITGKGLSKNDYSDSEKAALASAGTSISQLNARLNNPRKYMHISIDDTTAIWADLVANKLTYTSIFNNPILAYYKSLHDTYGIVISLYCFLDGLTPYYTQLSQYTAEFSTNAYWLKFGIHAANNSANYAVTTYSQAQTDYNLFVNCIYDITGNMDSIDRLPRLANFAGSLPACAGMRDCACGVLGFLTSDDVRASYYLATTKTRVDFTLETGSISNADGSNTSDTTRLRTIETLYLQAGSIASFNTTGAYKLTYTSYTGAGVIITQPTWSSDAIVIPTTGYYRFILRSTIGTDNISGATAIALYTASLTITNIGDGNNYIETHSKYFDAVNQLCFFTTNYRAENVSNIATTLAALSTAATSNKNQPLTMFTHEWEITTNPTLVKPVLEAFCQWAVQHGYYFDFPMFHV